MNEIYSIILSAGEIYVLAGMLGYSTVFAVEDLTLKQWQTDLKKHIKAVTERLEKRMLIYCEPSGIIYFDDNLLELIHCLCSPESAALISGTAATGRYSETYCFKRNNKYAELTNIAGGAYKITLFSQLDLNRLVSCVLPASEGVRISECISFETVQMIKDEIAAFNFDKANKYINKYVCSSDSAEYVLKTLSLTERYLRIRCIRNEKSYYSSTYNCFVVLCRGASVIMLKDENGIVHFDSVSQEQLKSELKAALDGKG